jgi:antitoxin YefM
MKAVTISTLRKDMKEYFDYVSESSEIIIVPQSVEEDSIVIMSIKEYNALMETEYLLSSKKNREKLQESIQQMRSNKTIAFK